jgi:transcriptional regulator NrdR family protein
MKCPVCGTYTEVIDSRLRGDNIRRRRYVCANEHRFTTNEIVIPSKPEKEKDDELDQETIH